MPLSLLNKKILGLSGVKESVCDFVFYSAISDAFMAVQLENALASVFLVFSFIGTSGKFLAFATFAEKRIISTEIWGKKAFITSGVNHGAETIFMLLAMVIWSSYFIFMVFGFGFLCWVTIITPIYGIPANE